MKVSLNVLTWNNKDTIAQLLEAAKCDLDGIDSKFIMVDNGSTDGTVEIIEEWFRKNPNIIKMIIKNPDNLGISIGKNQGIDNSVGEYIFMLDGDVIPVTNTIRLMIQWMDDNPDKNALGMMPNKFSTTPDHAEKFCEKLVLFKEHPCCCLYYGVFRKKMFYSGLRLSTEGEFGKAGYGWEDHDFFKRMKAAGFIQYVAHINKECGKYYHAINSSIRAMGREKYIETSRIRGKQFHEVWDAVR